MTKKEAREYAALLYMKNDGLTLQEIADKVGVHANTITKWKKEDDWDGIASVLLTTRHEQLKRMYIMLKNLNDAIMTRKDGENFPTKGESDVMTQITNSIEKLEKEMKLGVVIDVFTKFLRFASKIDGLLSKQIAELLDKYIKSYAG